MLSIKNLHVSVDGKAILNGLNLKVKQGEIHAIMGPNGSGKSSLASVIAGKDGYTIEKGEVMFCQEDLLSKSIDERAKMGVFLAFQYPVEIPGVSIANFLRLAVNEQRIYRNEKELGASSFLKKLRDISKDLDIDKELISRSLNEDFSGGEKKRNEILQLCMLDSKLAILDETDSGLDIDALRIIAKGINASHSKQKAIIVITHYQRLLNYIVPDYIHILYKGKIIKSGSKELAMELEEKGYDWVKNQN